MNSFSSKDYMDKLLNRCGSSLGNQDHLNIDIDEIRNEVKNTSIYENNGENNSYEESTIDETGEEYIITPQNNNKSKDMSKNLIKQWRKAAAERQQYEFDHLNNPQRKGEKHEKILCCQEPTDQTHSEKIDVETNMVAAYRRMVRNLKRNDEILSSILEDKEVYTWF